METRMTFSSMTDVAVWCIIWVCPTPSCIFSMWKNLLRLHTAKTSVETALTRNLILMVYVKTSLKKQVKRCQRHQTSQQTSFPIPTCTDMDTTAAATTTTTTCRAVVIPSTRTTRLLLNPRDILLSAAGATGFLAATDTIR